MVRSTVATTRSKRRSGAAPATGAGYPQPAVAMPLVSVVLAARDAEATVGEAVGSVLRQTVEDLELVVVDDGSVDGTGDVLAAVADQRLRVLRNEKPLGLAGALNAGLDVARGTHVARMDADDVALPRWLERVVGADTLPARLRRSSGPGRSTSTPTARSGAVHRMPVGARAIRWAALFSSPFFHPTVVVDRAVLERHGLRYDTSFAESEDYDLWTRLLDVADGDNVPDGARPLPSARRAGLHAAGGAAARMPAPGGACGRSTQIAPALTGQAPSSRGAQEADWRFRRARRGEAADALRELVEAFEARYGGRRGAPRGGLGARCEAPSAARGARGSRARGASRSIRRCPWVRCAERWRRRRSARAERAAAAAAALRAGRRRTASA